MNSTTSIPLILRGEIIEGNEISLNARNGGLRLSTPDPLAHAGSLTLARPSQMYDLLDLRLDDVLDYLEHVGRRLDPAINPHMAAAHEVSRMTSGLSHTVLRRQYQLLPDLFRRDVVADMTERGIGSRYLDGWVIESGANGEARHHSVRAFGARAVHVIAGNAPTIAALSIVRNCITRSDALIKSPSNDPLTAAAIARTMIEIDAEHPLTRHLAVAFWKGGDARIESRILDPRRVEKLIAWGGLGAIQHSMRSLQPGIDLIAFEPKHSVSIIGESALRDEQGLRTAAERLALDIGALDQEACFSSRVAYAICGSSEERVDRARRLGELTFAALQALPADISSPRQKGNPLLKDELDGLRLAGGEHVVFGGRANEGAIIVSLDGQAVDFAQHLAGRTANIVPVPSLESAVLSLCGYTQTVGVFPESLKLELRDRASCHGVQRFVSLGRASSPEAGVASAQDGMEPLRRMCRWVSDESARNEGVNARERRGAPWCTSAAKSSQESC